MQVKLAQETWEARIKAILALLLWLVLSAPSLAELPTGKILLISEHCLGDICIEDNKSKVLETLKTNPYTSGFTEIDLNKVSDQKYEDLLFSGGIREDQYTSKFPECHQRGRGP